MKKAKRNSIVVTIILHSLIILGIGHGIGIIGIIDIVCIPNLIDNHSFTFIGEFNDKIMTIGVISLAGKILLITSLFLKSPSYKKSLEISGMLGLWISVFFLTFGDWDYNSVYAIAFWTSLPFLISSLNLIFLIFRYKIKY